MDVIHQEVRISFRYPVHFTSGLFQADNPVLRDTLAPSQGEPPRALFVLDDGLLERRPGLPGEVEAYAGRHADALSIAGSPLALPGGERVKQDESGVRAVLERVDALGIDRHSFVVAVGGGALLDAVGYAAAIAHRGVRLVRVPTTVLSQNDSAVGVKNGVNAFGKKNFLGTFAPPHAVINDHEFLETLDDRDWRSGISEAAKVALIKDAPFFEALERDAPALRARDPGAMRALVRRCAELHLEHIAGGDPFERGSARPLDFGHWAAHKLEALSGHRLRHGEAVAVGIALDSTYSHLAGFLPHADWTRALGLLEAVGLPLWAPELGRNLERPGDPASVLRGLTEFREHLGGRLSVTLLERVGRGFEAHEMDEALIRRAIATLARRAGAAVAA